MLVVSFFLKCDISNLAIYYYLLSRERFDIFKPKMFVFSSLFSLVKFSAKKGPKFWWEFCEQLVFLTYCPFDQALTKCCSFNTSYLERSRRRMRDRKLSQFSLSANAKAASPHKCEQLGIFFDKKSLRFGHQ